MTPQACNPALFPLMRQLGAESDRHYAESARLAPRGGALAVGGAAEDCAQKGEAVASFLRGLRNGSSPADAATDAKRALVRVVEAHNARRADVTWQRDPHRFSGFIDSLALRAESSLAQSEVAA